MFFASSSQWGDIMAKRWPIFAHEVDPLYSSGGIQFSMSPSFEGCDNSWFSCSRGLRRQAADSAPFGAGKTTAHSETVSKETPIRGWLEFVTRTAHCPLVTSPRPPVTRRPGEFSQIA